MYNTGPVNSESCLPSNVNRSSCGPLQEALCSKHCSVAYGSGICPHYCDEIFSFCKKGRGGSAIEQEDEHDDEDAVQWCVRHGLEVISSSSSVCFSPPGASASMSFVSGPALAPSFGWSEYRLHVHLRDSRGNALAASAAASAALSVSFAGRTLSAVTSSSLSSPSSSEFVLEWFQQRLASLSVQLSSVHLPGSPFALSVQPRPRCLLSSAPPRPAREPLCPDFAGEPSCCPNGAPAVASALLHFRSQSSLCAAAWQPLLCAAACHPQQAVLSSFPARSSSNQQHQQFWLVSASQCRALRAACPSLLASAHCTDAVVPWSPNATLRLRVGERPSLRIAPRHCTVSWRRSQQQAGLFGEYVFQPRDASGFPYHEEQPYALRVYARHLPTGQMFAFASGSSVSSSQFTLAGPYLLRATVDGESVGVAGDQLLWVSPAAPALPVVDGTGCPDVYGNVRLDCARMAGVPSCAASIVAGRGLSILSPERSSFSVVGCDALQTPLPWKQQHLLSFRVLVNNVSVAIAPGGLVSYRLPRMVDSATIHVFCNGHPVPGSPWKATRPKSVWSAAMGSSSKGGATRQNVVIAAPPVTAVSVRLLASGNALVVQYDAPTASGPCSSPRSDVVSCYWRSSSELVLVLSYSSSLAVGELVQISGGVLPLGSPQSMPSVASTLPLLSSATPYLQPLVSISVSQRSSGSELVLDASGSFNLGGRLAAWSWFISSQDIVLPALDAAVRASNASVLTLSAALLGPSSRRLAFSVTVRSWTGAVGSSPLTPVLWEPSASPRLVPLNARILGPAVLPASSSSSFVLQGTIDLPIPTATTNVDYAWYPRTDNPFVAPSIDRILADTKNLAYSNLTASPRPYLLRYGVTYEAAAANENGSPMSILVVPAVYSRDASLRWPRSAPLMLDASQFVDDASLFSWVWMCSRVDFDGVSKPCFQPSFGLSTTSQQFIPQGLLQPGFSVFSVSFAAGVTAVFSVEAVLPEVPIVSISGPRFGLVPANTPLVLVGSARDPFAPCNAPCDLVYRWTSQDDGTILATTPVLRVTSLVPGQAYRYRFCASSFKGAGCVSVAILANAAPSSGMCSAQRIDNVVSVRCEAWQDDPAQGPLQYAFFSMDGRPLSAGFSTANTLSINGLPGSDAAVLVAVSDAFGSATQPFSVAITGGATTITTSGNAVQNAAFLGLSEVALFQCESVASLLQVRSASASARLSCWARLARSNLLRSDSDVASALTDTASLLSTATNGLALDNALAVVAAAAARSSTNNERLILSLLQRIRFVWDAGLPLSTSRMSGTLLARLAISHTDAMLQPPVVLPVSDCLAPTLLLVKADWNPLNRSDQCSQLAVLVPPSNVSLSPSYSFQVSGLSCAGLVGSRLRCESFSFVSLKWTPCGEMDRNLTCTCTNPESLAVALFAVPTAFVALPANATGEQYDLGMVGIGGLIAVACLAALAFLGFILLKIFKRPFAPMGKVVYRPTYAATSEVTVTSRPGAMRQMVSFGGADQREMSDVEHFE